MSIQSEITRISGNVSDAFTAIANKGGTVPTGANSDDLATAIASITTGGGLPNGIHDVTNDIVEYTGYTIEQHLNTYPNGYTNRITNTGGTEKLYKIPLTGWGITASAVGGGYLIISHTYNSGNINCCQFNTLPSSGYTDIGLWGAYNTDVAQYDENVYYQVHWLPSSNSGYNIAVQAANYGTINNLKAFYVRAGKAPAFQTVTLNLTSNTSSQQTVSVSGAYDYLGEVNYTVDVKPTQTTVFGTTSKNATSSGRDRTIDFGSTVGNTHPFSFVLLGGNLGSTSYATRMMIVKYDGSGLNGAGHFTVTYDSNDSYTAKINIPYCSITSAGVVTLRFSTAYYPWGTSSSSGTYQVPCTYLT